MLTPLNSLRWQDILDILIVAYLIYRVMLMIKGTRAVQMLIGIAVLIVIYFAARELEFLTLYWLLSTFLSSIFLIIIIIFQRDIRRALTQFGRTPFSNAGEATTQVLDEVMQAAYQLARDRIGALMVIERHTGLREYLEGARRLEAKVSHQLLYALFVPDSPLHDGAVVIKEQRVLAAGCLLPLTKNPYISKHLGTRHRAALGLTEETDAVVIVISEETGRVSLAQQGALTLDLDEKALRNRLEATLLPKEYISPQLWKSWLNK
ncbi:MAG: diadenylate cyclase CdaA [Desulfurivibrio sp.]|nr:diadenylate cyclase CdaA [Desulfurivibrio sp.]